MPVPVMFRDVTENVRMRVAEAGAGPPLVLLHGLFADHRSWAGVMSELAAEFRVVAPDLPGFGISEKPSSSRFAYDIEAFSAAVADLFGALSIRRAVVVGHGLGGATAITLAARRPELVSRLVLVNAQCYEGRPSVARRLATAPLVGDVLVKQLFGRYAFGAMLPEGSPRESVDRYYEAFKTPAGRGSALEALRGTTHSDSVIAHTGRLDIPALVLWGRRDRLYPAGQGLRLSKQIRGAGFEVIDGGHAPHEENPREVSERIRRFLMDERPSRT